MDYLAQLREIVKSFHEKGEITQTEIDTLYKIEAELQSAFSNHFCFIDGSKQGKKDALLCYEFISFQIEIQFHNLTKLIQENENPQLIAAYVKKCAEDNHKIYTKIPIRVFQKYLTPDINFLQKAMTYKNLSDAFQDFQPAFIQDPTAFGIWVFEDIFMRNSYCANFTMNNAELNIYIDQVLRTNENLRQILEKNTTDYENKFAYFNQIYSTAQHYFFQNQQKIYAFENDPQKHQELLFRLKFECVISDFFLMTLQGGQITSDNIKAYNAALESLINFIDSVEFLEEQYNTPFHKEMIAKVISECYLINSFLYDLSLAQDPASNQAHYYSEKTAKLTSYFLEENFKTSFVLQQFFKWFKPLKQSNHEAWSSLLLSTFYFNEKMLNIHSQLEDSDDLILQIIEARIEECKGLTNGILEMQRGNEPEYKEAQEAIIENLFEEINHLKIILHNLDLTKGNTRERRLIYDKAMIIEFFALILTCRFEGVNSDDFEFSKKHLALMNLCLKKYLNLQGDNITATFPETIIQSTFALTRVREALRVNRNLSLEERDQLEALIADTEQDLIKTIFFIHHENNNDLGAFYHNAQSHVVTYFETYFQSASWTIVPVIKQYFAYIQDPGNKKEFLEQFLRSLQHINQFADADIHLNELEILFKLKDYIDKHVQIEFIVKPISIKINDEIQILIEFKKQLSNEASQEQGDNQSVSNIVQMNIPNLNNDTQNSIQSEVKSPSLKGDLEKLIKDYGFKKDTNADGQLELYNFLLHEIKELAKKHGLSKLQERELRKLISQQNTKKDIDRFLESLNSPLTQDKSLKKDDIDTKIYDWVKTKTKYRSRNTEQTAIEVHDQPFEKTAPGDHSDKRNVDSPYEDIVIGDPESDSQEQERPIIGDPENQDLESQDLENKLNQLFVDTSDFDVFSPKIPEEVTSNQVTSNEVTNNSDFITMESFGPIIPQLDVQLGQAQQQKIIPHNQLGKILQQQFAQKTTWQKKHYVRSLILQAKLDTGSNFTLVPGANGTMTVVETPAGSHSSQNTSNSSSKTHYKKPHVKRPVFDKNAFKEFAKSNSTGGQATAYGIAKGYFSIKAAYYVMLYSKALLDEARGKENKISGQEAMFGLGIIALIGYAWRGFEKVSKRFAGYAGVALLVHDITSFLRSSRYHDYSDQLVKSPHFKKGLISKEYAIQLEKFHKEQTIENAQKLLKTFQRVIGFHFTKNLEILTQLDDKTFYQVKPARNLEAIHYMSAEQNVISLPHIYCQDFKNPITFSKLILIDRKGKKTEYLRQYIQPNCYLIDSSVQATFQWSSIVNDPDDSYYTNFDEVAQKVGYPQTENLSEILILDMRNNSVYSDSLHKGRITLSEKNKMTYHTIGRYQNKAITLRKLLHLAKESDDKFQSKKETLIVKSDIYKQAALFQHNIEDPNYGKAILPILQLAAKDLYLKNKMDSQAYKFVNGLKSNQMSRIVQIAHKLSKRTDIDNLKLKRFSEYYQSSKIQIMDKKPKSKINAHQESHLSQIIQQSQKW